MEKTINDLREQIKAKDKWIGQLLAACEYLSKEYRQIHGWDSLPAFVEMVMEDE